MSATHTAADVPVAAPGGTAERTDTSSAIPWGTPTDSMAASSRAWRTDGRVPGRNA